ncbi:endopeptidase La [Bacteroidia bacterium]|jgi:ATP-dependent Lon protease|nr:endopeptidase La [Bacteroidia bacterium]MDB4173950.1 endopeptidase La [Bacteroidia bacterium]
MTFDNKITFGGDFLSGEDGSEVISVIADSDFEDDSTGEYPSNLPLLPLRNTVLFPGVVFPITVGRDKSIKLIEDAYKADKIIGVIAQKDQEIEDPAGTDLYQYGTLGLILKMLKMPDGNITVIIQGKRKFELSEISQELPYFRGNTEAVTDGKASKSKETNATVESIRELASQIVEISPNIPTEANFALKNINSPNFLINFISSNLNVSVDEKQEILELGTFKKKANRVLGHLDKEIQILELKNKIQSKVKVDLDQQQKEYFLQQQIRAIHEELGHDSPDKEIENLRMRGAKKKWSEKVSKAFSKELDRLMRMNPSTPDYSVSLNYAELLLELPWGKYSKDNFDLTKAKKILDADHFGLEKVKERILEYLAVLKLKGDMKSPILCLYGPPGVGKTSLGKSIAKAMDREYVRMSLGGLHDESELRGHRKTYIGAMPGRIIQSLKKAGKSNPIFVLDEIDKIGGDHRGDPSSALLEVLDPEQNNAFHDNYVDLDYDLSKVLFVATANRLDTIQPALRDRMEIIDISGYTVEEKIGIAKKHLLPKQKKEHGLKASQVKMADKTIEMVVDQYTRESGVRSLDKRIAKICRWQAKEVVYGNEPKPTITAAQIEEILGKDKIEKDLYETNDIAGVVTGLAWTSVGGDILFVESSLTKGKGKVTLTGQLGSVMKESAVNATTWLKANAEDYGINPLIFDQYDLHIHFPAGAVPKDGPSAGITILTAITSLITQRKVKNRLAMTGEITLRGKVLPVGGIKEKILAAKRAGIKEIIMCKANKKDIDDIKPSYISDLKFHFVEHMSEVLDNALMKQKVSGAKTWTVLEESK